MSNELRAQEIPDANRTASRGMLVVVSSPSGGGKGTLIDRVLKTVPGVSFSVSYTTRAPRATEQDGREYFFADEATFQAMIDRHEFVEWARVYGHLYGTPRKTLTDKIDQGIDVLLEIDVQGALQVKKKFDDAVSVFILPPSMTVLRQRLLARASDSSDEIQRRLQKVKEEVWSYREYAYIVKNDDLTRSLRDLENIFLGERLKTKRLNMAWIENNFILDDDNKPGDRKDLP